MRDCVHVRKAGCTLDVASLPVQAKSAARIEGIGVRLSPHISRQVADAVGFFFPFVAMVQLE
jgi:hypothetical protein